MSWVATWAVIVPTFVLAVVGLSRGHVNPRVLFSNLAFLFAGVVCSWLVAPAKALAGTFVFSALVKSAVARLGVGALVLHYVRMAYLTWVAGFW
jgi:hypothetical protein